ncbi:MAG: hypothetical protein RJB31_501, partial [Bacteroidota bacterium]
LVKSVTPVINGGTACVLSSFLQEKIIVISMIIKTEWLYFLKFFIIVMD